MMYRNPGTVLLALVELAVAHWCPLARHAVFLRSIDMFVYYPIAFGILVSGLVFNRP